MSDDHAFPRTPLAALALALLLGVAFPHAARAGAIYGYEDPLGMLHTSKKRLSDKYVAIYETAPGKPKPSHAELVRILREKNAVEAPEGPLWNIANLPNIPPRVRPYPHPAAKGDIMKWIGRYSKKHRLDPKLVYAVIEQESNFCKSAVSPKGAMGLMQIMPDTQTTLGLADPFDPEANIEAGARFLRTMLNRFKDPRLALAAYNAGPETVKKHKGLPPYPETLQYVSRIMIRWSNLQSM